PRSVRIRLLVDHANGRNELARLVRHVCGLNPAAYFAIEPQLREVLLQRADREWDELRAPFLTTDRKGNRLEPTTERVNGGYGSGPGLAVGCGIPFLLVLVVLVWLATTGRADQPLVVVLPVLLLFFGAMFLAGVLGWPKYRVAWRNLERYQRMKTAHDIRRCRLLALGSGTPDDRRAIHDAVAALTEPSLALLWDEFPALRKLLGKTTERSERMGVLLRFAFDEGTLEVDRLLAGVIRLTSREREWVFVPNAGGRGAPSGPPAGA